MRRRFFVVAVIGCALLAACGDAFSPEGVSGTYALKSIDGEPLPYSETESGITLSVPAGSLTLTPEETYLLSLTLEISDGNTTISSTETTSGTFSLVEPNTINFSNEDGTKFAGVHDGNSITMAFESSSFRWEK